MGWFSTPSIPTPPPPPSASEISAASIESAQGLTRLQRAMQFGLPLAKVGVRQEGQDLPRNSKKKYGDKDYSEIDGPTYLGPSEAEAWFQIAESGLISEIRPDLAHVPEWKALLGKPYQEIYKANPSLDADRYRGGEQQIYRVEKDQFIGWETPSGEMFEPPTYFEVQDSTGKTADEKGFNKATAKEVELTREEALDADFSQMGDTDVARMQFEFQKETSPEQNDFILAQAKKYGLGEGLVDAQGEPTMGFIEAAAEGVKKADPLAYDVRKALADKALGYEAPGVPTVDEMERFGEFGKLPTAETLKTPTDPLGEALSEEFGGRPVYEGPETVMEEMRRMEAGKTPTFRETTDAERPTLTDAGAMADLDRFAAFGGMEKAGELGGLEEAQAMDALTRLGAKPTLDEARAFGDYERAGEMGALGRLGEFGGYERAAAMGDLERAGAMDALERSEAARKLERLEDRPELVADPETMAERRYIQEQLFGRAQTGETSRRMVEEARRLERGRQAASGNIFGGGAVLEEARAVTQAEDAGQRRAVSDYLGFLSSGQSAEDYETRLGQQNLANRLTGIQQRTGAEQAEFGMGQQVVGQRNVAALQERADALGALGQRNEAQEREYQSALAALKQRNVAAGGEYGFQAQRTAQANQAALQERADQLGALGQRNEAQDREYQNLLSQINQANQARMAGYGMEGERVQSARSAELAERADVLGAMGQRNEAQEREYQAALQSIGQRNLAATTTYGLGTQRTEQGNVASLQERADELAAIGQRNEVQQQEFQNLQASLAQINQTKQAQLAAEMQTAGFDNTVIQQERADELGAMSQRNEAEEAEFRSLLQGLQQQQAARTGGFGMEAQAMGQRNAAQEADFAKEQAAMAQRNQARQQSFTNAMQRTATQEQMQQQQMANLQSFSGLAPVSGQFAGLSGAQQQAGASVNPMQYQRTDAGQLLQGQQNLAASNFGTQAGIWGQQAQAAAQPSGFGSLLGTVAGGWAGTASGGGAITGGLKKLLGQG